MARLWGAWLSGRQDLSLRYPVVRIRIEHRQSHVPNEHLPLSRSPTRARLVVTITMHPRIAAVKKRTPPRGCHTSRGLRKFPAAQPRGRFPSAPSCSPGSESTSEQYVYNTTSPYTMASVIRSFRAATALPLTAFARPSPLQARAFGFSAIRKAGGGPPQLLGPGAKAGEVPTE